MAEENRVKRKGGVWEESKVGGKLAQILTSCRKNGVGGGVTACF